MDLLSELAYDTQDALADLMSSFTYQPQAGQSFTCKLASTVAPGTTSITVEGLPASMGRVLQGDVVRINPYSTKYVCSALPPVLRDGSCGPIPISPATDSMIAAGAIVTIIRNGPVTVMGIVMAIDVSRLMVGSLVSATDVKVLVQVPIMHSNSSTAIKPAAGDKITVNGRVSTIYSVQTDPAGAFHTILAR